MAIIILQRKPSGEEIKQMSEAFGNYIKVVVDLEKEILAGGCKLHADCEKILIDQGSKQENLWGGGFDLSTRSIDDFALMNIRPAQGNPSQEILDQITREKFSGIVKKYFL